jgi:hypothetical protein
MNGRRSGSVESENDKMGLLKKVLLIFGAGSLLCIGAGALLFFGVFSLTQPVVDASNAFMGELRDADYNTAFDMTSSSLRSELGNAGGMETVITQGNIFLAEWAISGREVNNQLGSVRGTATMQGGNEANFEIALAREDDVWKISGFSFSDAR